MEPCTLTDLTAYFARRGGGFGMFNIVNLEFAQAIYDAAQETNTPAMFGIPERFMLNYYEPDSLAAALLVMCRRSAVPLSIHLDHGKSFVGVMKAIQCGFSSVMFDGSALDYEENIARTAEVVKIAHAMGVSVEGELGYVGSAALEDADESGFTRPEQAEDFVRRTGVDALAIAIGNQHGQYRGVPKLDFARLKAIRKQTPCALVLHGGSGIEDSDFKEAIRCGIAKVNIYTAMDIAARRFTGEHFADYTSYLDYTKDFTKAVKEVVKDHIQLFAHV